MNGNSNSHRSPVGLGGFPSSHQVGNRSPGRDPGRIDRGDENDRHDHRCRGDRSVRRVVQIDPDREIEGDDHLPEGLAKEVPHGNPYDGVHAGLGNEEKSDVHRRQPDSGVDVDFAETLVHRPHHGVENDQPGDQHRNQQRLESFDRGQPHGGVRGDRDAVGFRVARPCEQRHRSLGNEPFDHPPEVAPGFETHGHGPQLPSCAAQRLERQNDDVVRVQVHESPWSPLPFPRCP